ncbi:CsaA family protein [Leptospira langatensis]|uniref:CsaA family protein n=1 Tax=Leptospira langatensis TaxID=2484983 RepID=A0A5F1ZSB6_9LEPT|nr:CsaA family protein [Leptospira langatensis]TGK02816.1 CsaA family protein [Leptospira langatensis]TGL39979.1 CsaA family protein [Leptospira langatensis]
MMESTEYTDLVSEKPFADLDLRIGKVVGFELVLEHGEKAYRLILDFGQTVGVRRSSEVLPSLGEEGDLLSKQALCVLDYPSANVARMRAQALFLGFMEDEAEFTKNDAIDFARLAS